MDEKWKTSPQIAKLLKIDRSTVNSIGRKYDLPIKKEGYNKWYYNIEDIKSALARGHLNSTNQRFINPTPTKEFTDFWRLDWDEFIVGADLHVPLINEEIFNNMLKVAESLKIKKFIHAGDFFDQATFSSFDTYQEDLIDWGNEIKSAKATYKILANTFDEVKFFMGSHDLRFWRMLNKAGKATNFNSAFIQAEIPGQDTSRYRYAEVGTEWHLTHPRNVVKINSIPMLRIGAKYQRSIVAGHGHWWGIYRDPSGTHYQVAPGCLTDVRKHAYATLWDTSHDRWTPGFLAVVERNKPILFANDSPWGIYLNERHRIDS